MTSKFPLTVRSSKSSQAMDKPGKMQKRKDRAEEVLIHNVREGEALALSRAPCTCRRVATVAPSGATTFALVIEVCRRCQSLRVVRRG